MIKIPSRILRGKAFTNSVRKRFSEVGEDATFLFDIKVHYVETNAKLKASLSYRAVLYSGIRFA